MRCTIVLGCLGFALGCSPSAPPLVLGVAPTTPVSDWKVPAKPAETTPQAKAMLAEMVAAHTGNEPKRLDKLGAIRLERSGYILMDANTPVRMACKEWIAAGVKLHLDREMGPMSNGVTIQTTDVFNNGQGHTTSNVKPKEKLTDAGLSDADKYLGEEGLVYLFSFDNPSLPALIEPMPKQGDRDVVGLHVWLPRIDHALLYLDAKSKLIVRARYDGSEGGHSTHKDIVVTEHKDFGGLQLPVKYSVKGNGKRMFEWESLVFEVGGPFDPKLFEVP